MWIRLKNIGKIKDAKVKINGITVIAGENNTGKSTIGKSLYSVFNSLYHMDEAISSLRISGIISELPEFARPSLMRRLGVSTDEAISARKIIEKMAYEKSESSIRAHLEDIYSIIEKNNKGYWKEIDFERVYKRVREKLTLSDHDIIESIMGEWLIEEFNSQVLNVFATEGIIQIGIKDQKVSLQVREDGTVSLDGEMSLGTEAVFIDDPYVIDDAFDRQFVFSPSHSFSHRDHLRMKLRRYHNVFSGKTEMDNDQGKADVDLLNRAIANVKLKAVYEKVSSIFKGDIILHSDRRANYKVENTDKELDIRNLSTGMKTFAIIKELLQDGVIVENGVLILDEPEIHLHPEWQLVLAEIVVLLQKEFEMHVLLNTHSPYFLSAIEVFSKKHGIDEKCSYYYANTIDEKYADITEVTDNLEMIYKGLARPLQELENIRYED